MDIFSLIRLVNLLTHPFYSSIIKKNVLASFVRRRFFYFFPDSKNLIGR